MTFKMFLKQKLGCSRHITDIRREIAYTIHNSDGKFLNTVREKSISCQKDSFFLIVRRLC